jgi:hypothetical protein
MLDWLKKAGVRRTLQAVAAHRAITNEALDALPPGRTLVHLRSMKVATGALPARDERLVALERWIGQVVAERTSPEHPARPARLRRLAPPGCSRDAGQEAR